MKKAIFLAVLLGFVVAPATSQAAWWNPLTWFNQPKTIIVEKIVYVVATTTTPVATSSQNVIVATSTATSTNTVVSSTTMKANRVIKTTIKPQVKVAVEAPRKEEAVVIAGPTYLVDRSKVVTIINNTIKYNETLVGAMEEDLRKMRSISNTIGGDSSLSTLSSYLKERGSIIADQKSVLYEIIRTDKELIRLSTTVSDLEFEKFSLLDIENHYKESIESGTYYIEDHQRFYDIVKSVVSGYRAPVVKPTSPTYTSCYLVGARINCSTY